MSRGRKTRRRGFFFFLLLEENVTSPTARLPAQLPAQLPAPWRWSCECAVGATFLEDSYQDPNTPMGSRGLKGALKWTISKSATGSDSSQYQQDKTVNVVFLPSVFSCLSSLGVFSDKISSSDVKSII